jgi:hypothetical protein
MILSSLLLSQGHTFAALDVNNLFTGNNTFSGTTTTTGPTITSILNGVQYVNSALSRGGADIGAEINLAYASLPSPGGTIFVSPNSTCYNFSTEIVFNTVGKIVNLTGAGSGPTCLNWTGSSTGTAFVINWGGNLGINGHPGVISNLTLCYMNCNISGATSTTVGANVGNGPNFPTQGVIFENVAMQGWGTAAIMNAFDSGFVQPMIANNGIGVNFNAGSVMWILQGTTFQNTIEDILLGTSVDVYIQGTDIETNLGTGSLGIVMPANFINLTLNGVHLEMNGVGSTGDFIKSTGSNNNITMLGGLMLADTGVGTIPEFITFSGDSLNVQNTTITASSNTLTNGYVHAIAFGTIQWCPRTGGALPTLISGAGNPSVNYCTTQLSGNSAAMKLQNYRLQISDQGTCTLSSGTCPGQNFATTYAVAPQCFGSWNGIGTMTGILSFVTSTTGVTPTDSVGSDTGHINWFCLGN